MHEQVAEGQGKGSSRKKELSAPEKPGFSSSWQLALLNKVRLPGAPVALQRRRFEEEAKARRDVPRPTRKQDVSRRTTAPVNAMNSLCASGGGRAGKGLQPLGWGRAGAGLEYAPNVEVQFALCGMHLLRVLCSTVLMIKVECECGAMPRGLLLSQNVQRTESLCDSRTLLQCMHCFIS